MFRKRKKLTRKQSVGTRFIFHSPQMRHQRRILLSSNCEDYSEILVYKHSKSSNHLILKNSENSRDKAITRVEEHLSIAIDSDTELTVASDVLQIDFDSEFDLLEIHLEASSCAFPFFISSDREIAFLREPGIPEMFHIANLEQSNIASFVGVSDRPRADYSISTRSSDGNFRKFFYVICPFFSGDEKTTQVTIRLERILRKPAKTVDVGFDTSLPWETFINQLFLDGSVIKKSMKDLIDPKEMSHYNINFDKSEKYLVYVIDSVYGFSLQTNHEVAFIYIMSEDFKTYKQVAKEKRKVLEVSVAMEKADEENPEPQTQSKGHYFYFEKADEAQVSLMVSGDNGSTTFMSILENNWKYFLFLFLFIFLIILWKVIKRIRNKIKEKNQIHQKLNEKKQKEDIESQRESRRITKILNMQRNTLSGKQAITQENERVRLQSQLEQLSNGRSHRRQSMFYSHRMSGNQMIRVSRPKSPKLEAIQSLVKEEPDQNEPGNSRDSIDVFDSLSVRNKSQKKKADHRKRLSQRPRMLKKEDNQRFSVRSKKSKQLRQQNFTFRMQSKTKSQDKTASKKKAKSKRKYTKSEESNETHIHNINDSVITTEMNVSVFRSSKSQKAN